MLYDFDKIINRNGTSSMKWSQEGILPFTTADMDFEMPDAIKDAITRRLSHGILGYTFAQNDEYLDSIIDWNRDRYGWNIAKDSIMVSHGVVDGFMKVIEAVCAPDEAVIIQTPAYFPYFSIKRKQLINPLVLTDNGYEVDFEQFEQLCSDEKAKVFMLCSPHNPTGKIFTEEELMRFVEICARHNVLILSDEIHADWTRIGKSYVPLLKLMPDVEAIAFISASKTFNLAGLELSNIIVPQHMRRTYGGEDPFVQGANPLSMAAVMGAYSPHGRLWLEEARSYVDENIDYFIKRLGEALPEMRVIKPDATYMVWVDIRKYTGKSTVFNEKMRRLGAAAVPGEAFGTGGFLRVTLACPRSYIDILVEKMVTAVTEL